MKTRKLIYGVVLTALFACNSEEKEVEKRRDFDQTWANAVTCKGDWQKYVGETFSICFPSDWTVDDSGTMGSEIILTYVQPGSEERAIKVNKNVNIIKQNKRDFEAQGIQDFEAYAQYSKEQVLKSMTNSQIMAFVKTEISGIDAYRNMMTADVNGMKYHFEQFIYENMGFYYVITFTTVNDDTLEGKRLGSDIIQTVTLKKD